jgi:hypothetical protein
MEMNTGDVKTDRGGGGKKIFLLFQFLFILFNSPVGGVEYTEGESGYTAQTSI